MPPLLPATSTTNTNIAALLLHFISITLSQPLLAQPGKTLSLQMRRRQASRNDRGAQLEPRAARKQNGKRAFISRRRGCIPLHGQVAAADFNSPSCGSEVKWRLTDCPLISMPELCRTRVCACPSATEKLRCLEVLLCAGARPKCSAQVAACVLIVPSRCASALRKWLFLSASSLSKFSALRLTTTQQLFDVSPMFFSFGC